MVLDKNKLKLEAEVEVDELHGVEEVWRTPRLPDQLDGEKSLEEFQSVQRTRLLEIKQNHKQPLLE